MISNTSSFEIGNCFFLVGGPKLSPPLIKHLVEGLLPPVVTNLFSRAFQQLKSTGISTTQIHWKMFKI